MAALRKYFLLVKATDYAASLRFSTVSDAEMRRQHRYGSAISSIGKARLEAPCAPPKE
jgi:hypothetical protein